VSHADEVVCCVKSMEVCRQTRTERCCILRPVRLNYYTVVFVWLFYPNVVEFCYVSCKTS